MSKPKNIGVSFVVAAAVCLFGFGLTPLASAADPSPQELACNGSGGKFEGGSCKENTGNGPTIKSAVKIIVNTLLFFVGIFAVIVLVISGLRFVAANGEAQQVSKARTNIIYAIIGIVVALAGYAIVNFILGQI